jgi:hypothetical protein
MYHVVQEIAYKSLILLAGCPSWIRIEPCALFRSQNSGGSSIRSGRCRWQRRAWDPTPRDREWDRGIVLCLQGPQVRPERLSIYSLSRSLAPLGGPRAGSRDSDRNVVARQTDGDRFASASSAPSASAKNAHTTRLAALASSCGSRPFLGRCIFHFERDRSTPDNLVRAP